MEPKWLELREGQVLSQKDFWRVGRREGGGEGRSRSRATCFQVMEGHRLNRF